MADNGCVSYAEFSSVWTAIYHDSLDVATKFVTNMDMDHDGCLDDIEVLVNGVRNNQHLKIGSYMTSHPNAYLLYDLMQFILKRFTNVDRLAVCQNDKNKERRTKSE